MEFGDASDEEAPPPPPRNKGLSKTVQMQIVAMLQGMESIGSLKRGSVTTIAKRFSMVCCTVHYIWKQAEHMHAAGIINSPEFYSWKKFRDATYLSDRVCL